MNLNKSESCKNYGSALVLNNSKNYEEPIRHNIRKLNIQHFIRNDSPYLSQYEKGILEHLKNKTVLLVTHSIQFISSIR